MIYCEIFLTVMLTGAVLQIALLDIWFQGLVKNILETLGNSKMTLGKPKY